MSNVIEWKTRDADDVGSYGVVTCPGPFFGEFVRGNFLDISSDGEGEPKFVFRISLFSLSSGGWIPFIDSCTGVPNAENVFESLSRLSHGLRIKDRARL